MPDTTDLPGNLVDPATGLRAWNGRLILPGHVDKGRARAIVLARYPEADTSTELSPAFHEHIQFNEPYGCWVFGSDVPVTVLLIQPRDEEDQDDEPEPQTSDEPDPELATPAQVDAYLRQLLAPETYLRYQQALCGRAVGQAAAEQRLQAAHRSVTGAPLPEYVVRGWQDAANHVDPLKAGGRRWPAELIELGR